MKIIVELDSLNREEYEEVTAVIESVLSLTSTQSVVRWEI